MYLEHFGLNKSPFRITPDTRAFFEGSDRGATLTALCYVITQGEGIVKVVGEVGSGKTMLCRMLPSKLPDHIDLIYLAHPSLSPEHTLHAIAHEMGLNVQHNSSKLDVMNQLHSALVERHASGRQVVVMVEEAQGMPLETLEEIRLLSNLETDDQKLLQIVLFGQPELDVNLSKACIRQLRERITHHVRLGPLNADDIHEYLNFRLRSSGYTGPDLFSERVAKEIATYSEGLIRRVNIIADKTLMSAFVQGKHTITIDDIQHAARESEYKLPNKILAWFKRSLAATVCVGFAITSGMLDSSTTAMGTFSTVELQAEFMQAAGQNSNRFYTGLVYTSLCKDCNHLCVS